MNKITIILLCSFLSFNLTAQVKKKLKTSEQRYQVDQVKPIKARQNAIPNSQQNLFSSSSFQYQPITGFKTLHSKLIDLKVVQKSKFGIPLMINGRVENNALFRNQSPLAKSLNYLDQAKNLMQINAPSQEFQLKNHFTDHLETSHTKLQQYYKGVKVYNGEVILHAKKGTINLLNGRYYPTPNLENLSPSLDAKSIEQLVISNINQKGKFRPFSDSEKKLNNEKQIQTELVILHEEMNPKKERLVWHVKAYASLITMNEYFVDAHSGEIISSFNGICKIDGHHHTKNHQHNDLSYAKETRPKTTNNTTTNFQNNMPPLGGSAVQVTSEDLFGHTITLDVWDNNGVFHMIDASKAMYNSGRSNLPDEGLGVIATLDARNKAPSLFGGYSAIDVTSNNNWNAIGVSAHSNSSIVFDYYKNTFGRNSIDGSGGNMFSIINVVDEDGEAMDNAFYSGGNMYYGNGNGAFSPLAKALDVAAHEISHGVINNTANLEYKFQSGAMNESFADVFGSLIDREDWLMGEDVVNTQFFPSGALRNLEDPNNGATRGSQNWQPKHMDEYVTLAADKDNGGVHINSGIPNRAYFLFANTVGKNKAEQVYYRALTTYLTRSSQFIDLRAAVIQSAKDIHGDNSSEVNAAANAFAGVGIGDPSPGGGDTVNDYEEDVEINPGEDFIISTDEEFNNLYLFDFNEIKIISQTDILSKPSITDDGTFAIFVAKDETIKSLEIDWSTNPATLVENTIHDEALWRNVAISKDGLRVAALTNDNDNRLWVFDFISRQWQTYDLYNPTTAEGVNSGNVKYADAMEWDFSGEQVLYDAFNQIPKDDGTDIEYWDIGFIQAWNNSTNDFGNGTITKLIPQLPDGTSIGNPTFSKNSPYILAFDFRDADENYFILAANVEKNDISTIFESNTWGYPNYSRLDDKIVFDFLNNGTDQILATIDLHDDKITGDENTAVGILNTAKWGVWFAPGDRDFNTSTEESTLLDEQLKVFPNPFDENLNIQLTQNFGEELNISIFNMLGQKVFQQHIDIAGSTYNGAINLSNLNAGNYLLQISNGNLLTNRKLLKIK